MVGCTHRLFLLPTRKKIMQNKILTVTNWDCTESDADVTLAIISFPRCTLDPVKSKQVLGSWASTRALDRVHMGPTPLLPSLHTNQPLKGQRPGGTRSTPNPNQTKPYPFFILCFFCIILWTLTCGKIATMTGNTLLPKTCGSFSWPEWR